MLDKLNDQGKERYGREGRTRREKVRKREKPKASRTGYKPGGSEAHKNYHKVGREER